MAGKILVVPVLVFNFVAAIIIVGLAGWYQDKTITAAQDDTPLATEKDLQGFEGNAATTYLITYSLIAGMVSLASYFVGVHHLRVWTLSSAAATQSAAWIAFLLLMLPFALVWKEIALDTHRAQKIKTLESFVIILTFVHFLYTMLFFLYSPNKSESEMSQV